MLQKLTVVAPRDNDSLTLRRGHALAQVLLLLMVIGVGLAALSLNDRDLKNFQPRIGLAYHPLTKWVFRGGLPSGQHAIVLVVGPSHIDSAKAPPLARASSSSHGNTRESASCPLRPSRAV